MENLMYERTPENCISIINEFADYLNSFNSDTIKEFSFVNEISTVDYEYYKKAINAVLMLSKRTEKAEEYKEKAKIANDYLDKLKKC